MRERLNLEESDIRNLFIVIGMVSLAFLFLTEGTVVVRVVTAVIAAIISGISFLVFTVVINRYKPSY